MSTTVVLLTGVGGPTPRAIARALRKYGRFGPYRIVGTDINRLALGLYQSQYVDKSYVVPRAGADDYWPAIEAIIRQEGVQAAVVEAEAEVEAWAMLAQSRKLPCPALIPDLGLVRVLRDKALMAEMLEGTRFIGHSLSVRRDGDFRSVGRALGYPYWLRGTMGSSGYGALKIEDEGSAAAWVSLNANIDSFLATEFLPGRNLTCKLLYDHSTLLRAACGERVEYIMAKVAPSGITGNTAFGRLLNLPQVVEFSVQCVRALCDRLGVEPHGFLSVDLKEDRNGMPRVTEMNVRHVAFTEAFAAAGANLAEDTLQLTLGRRDRISAEVLHRFPANYIFLRDVDAEPVILCEDDLLPAR